MKKTSLSRTLILLALPAVAENVLSTLLQYVDTAMVGHLGEKATAAVNLTTTISWLIGSIAASFGIALISMLSQAVGRKDEKSCRIISSQAFAVVIILGLSLGVISLVLSPFIPVWMGANAEIIADARTYFFIISLPMLFRVSTIVFSSALRAVKDTKTPMLISLAENVLNIALNALFIYGLGLGVKGAALGSALSYTAAGAATYICYRKNKYLDFDFKKFSFHKETLKKYLSTAYPVMLTSVASCLGYVVFAGLVARMGNTVFAAHSIAVEAETLFYIAGYGLRSATSTMTGISIGEQDKNKFRSVERLSILMTTVMMAVSGVTLYLVAYPFMKVFTSSEAVAVLGSRMLRLVAFSEPFFGLMIVCEGIFYGLGSTKYIFITETASMWGIRILFTFICVNVLHTGLQEVWYCMIADNVMKALLLSAPFLLRRVKMPEQSPSAA